MKPRHALHIILFATISIVFSSLVFFITDDYVDAIFTVFHILGYAWLPFLAAMAILFIGLILNWAKRPKWKAIYTVAWIVFGIIHIASLYGSLAFQRDYQINKKIDYGDYLTNTDGEPVLHNDYLAQVAEDFNLLCPMAVSENIVIQNAAALPGKKLVYNAWIIDRYASDVDVPIFQSIMKPPILNQIKSQNELKILRDIETTIIYKYFDKEGNCITEIEITPEDYSD